MTTTQPLDTLPGMPERIENEADMRAFFVALLRQNVNFHPDDAFKDYMNSGGGGRSFTDALAGKMETLIDQAFKLFDDRVYTVALEVFNAPIPS